jgi:esterase/lipase
MAAAHDTTQYSVPMEQMLIVMLVACVSFVAAARGETLGVVMMHGKTAMPGQLAALDASVSDAGFLVERPQMCWSRTRIYDRPYLDCLKDADGAAAALKARGASAIVILGMSLGGNGALSFGARRPGLKGVIALAPASAPDQLARHPAIARSLAEARSLIAAGKSEEQRTFSDLNNGRELTVTTTPAIYVTFFGEDSPGVMTVNAQHLTAPLLMVSGTEDSTQGTIAGVFALAPSDPHNSRVMVRSDHVGTPAAATEAVVAWLKSLAK